MFDQRETRSTDIDRLGVASNPIASKKARGRCQDEIHGMPRCNSNLSPAQGFVHGQGGGGAVETAGAMAILAFLVFGIAASVSEFSRYDLMNSAANAAAAAVALSPGVFADSIEEHSTACDAIKVELVLPSSFVCGSTWDLAVETRLKPADLFIDPFPASDSRDGNMVVVVIDWNWKNWPFSGSPPSGQAIGLARAEPGDDA